MVSFKNAILEIKENGGNLIFGRAVEDFKYYAENKILDKC